MTKDAVLRFSFTYVVICDARCEVCCACVYLHSDGVSQSPDGHCVQKSIGQVCDSAPHHFHISAAVQLVPQFQLIFANREQQHNLAI